MWCCTQKLIKISTQTSLWTWGNILWKKNSQGWRASMSQLNTTCLSPNESLLSTTDSICLQLGSGKWTSPFCRVVHVWIQQLPAVCLPSLFYWLIFWSRLCFLVWFMFMVIICVLDVNYRRLVDTPHSSVCKKMKIINKNCLSVFV